jgi:hypothetical protein
MIEGGEEVAAAGLKGCHETEHLKGLLHSPNGYSDSGICFYAMLAVVGGDCIFSLPMTCLKVDIFPRP